MNIFACQGLNIENRALVRKTLIANKQKNPYIVIRTKDRSL